MTTYTLTAEQLQQLLDALKDGVRVMNHHNIPLKTAPLHDALAMLKAMVPVPRQEPVAYRYDFDGYGWRFIDNGSGSSWKERATTKKDAEPLFAHPEPLSKPTT